MVQAYGKSGFKFNAIDEGEFDGPNTMGGKKEKRGGVGRKGSKSNNYKEAKVANRRRNEKL